MHMKVHSNCLGRILILLLPAGAFCQVLGPDAPRFHGSVIVSARPLSDVAEVLQSRYAKAVTYEDPVLAWRGDTQSVTAPSGRIYQTFLERTINLPPGLSPDQSPILDAALLGRALTEYEKLNDTPRFRIATSGLGLHIIPDTVRDAGGIPAAAKNPLDIQVTIPRATRTASDHFLAICAALSPASSMRVDCLAVGLNEDWYEKLFAAPGGTLEWGASGMNARDALIDLLDHSATTFSWRLLCGAPGAFDGHSCSLNLDPIRFAKTAADGSIKVERLEYDRCNSCAPRPKLP